MAVSRGALGMNARNFLYVRRYNTSVAKKAADNKLRTKRLLIKDGIATTRLIKAFNTRSAIRSFDWKLPEEGFVVKPARGYGGEGILVFRSWKKDMGTTVSGEIYTKDELESHIFDIFEGVYSLQDLPDKAYLEERVVQDKFFKKFVAVGLADIRVVLLRRIPVMAMLRIPTVESRGTANLHLGAIGVGIDLRTGITKHAVLKGKEVKKIPGTGIKTRGIKLPNWANMLRLAAKAQDVIEGLGYCGVDIVLDANRGPLVLEINARPGLEIQNANLDSLRSRLERVENINVANIDRGVELSQSLFAEENLEKVGVSPTMLSLVEPITILGEYGNKTYDAKVDSGALRTAIDWSIVRDLKLPILPHKILIRAANGEQLRSAVNLQYMIAGKKVKTVATVTERSHMMYKVIIGREDMKGFLINPNA